MTPTQSMRKGEVITINNEEIRVHKVDHDMYGNPRYVVHFSALNIQLKDYGRIKGLTKYRAKWFGGGYVFQSYNIKEDLRYALKTVKEYYDMQTPKTPKQDYDQELYTKSSVHRLTNR